MKERDSMFSNLSRKGVAEKKEVDIDVKIVFSTEELQMLQKLTKMGAEAMGYFDTRKIQEPIDEKVVENILEKLKA